MHNQTEALIRTICLQDNGITPKQMTEAIAVLRGEKVAVQSDKPKALEPVLKRQEVARLRLCDSSANFTYNRNTYRKLIRERDLGRCEDLLCALRSEISQDEHLNAENLGAIITNRLND